MSAEFRAPLLEAREIVSGYGGLPVLHGVSITIAEREIVALIGHNGSGKSTLLKSLFGIVPLMSGEVRLRDKRIDPPRPKRILQEGVAYIPQGQGVFDDLDVAENLEVAASILAKPGRAAAIEKSLTLFSELRPLWRRKCRSLSGGERQMVALAAALVVSPELLLLDEPTLGLAPQLAAQLLHHLSGLNAASGTAMMIVEQRIKAVLAVSHRALVMRSGEIAHSGTPNSVTEELLRQLAFAAPTGSVR